MGAAFSAIAAVKNAVFSPLQRAMGGIGSRIGADTVESPALQGLIQLVGNELYKSSAAFGSGFGLRWASVCMVLAVLIVSWAWVSVTKLHVQRAED